MILIEEPFFKVFKEWIYQHNTYNRILSILDKAIHLSNMMRAMCLDLRVTKPITAGFAFRSNVVQVGFAS